MKTQEEEELENPSLKTEKSLDEYMVEVNETAIDISILCDAGYGSYMEIAYEWSWEEAKNMLEILEIKKELEKRGDIKQRAETM